MILTGTAEQWADLWNVIEEEMAESTEKGLTVIFSVQEVETVCAVKMMQVRSTQQRVVSQCAGARQQLMGIPALPGCTQDQRATAQQVAAC